MTFSTFIAALTSAELAQLAEHLEAGTLRLDHSAARLEMRRLPEAWAQPLNELKLLGFQESSLALALRAVLDARAAGPRIDVVSTQPEAAESLLTGTAHSLRTLLTHAQHSVLLAGYSITDRKLLEPLVRHAHQQVSLDLFLDVPADKCDPNLPPHARAVHWYTAWAQDHFPVGLPTPRAWYAPSQLSPDADAPYRKMHMKTVLVDDQIWFVSSANFTWHGQHQNFELGARVDDPQACRRARQHFELLCQNGVFVRLNDD